MSTNRQNGPHYKLASGSKHLTVLLHSKVWTRLEKNIGLVAANPYAGQLGLVEIIREMQNIRKNKKEKFFLESMKSMECIQSP